jgi:hypothetical protein
MGELNGGRGRREEGDIPIASPGLTISMTIPIVSEVLLGEWGVLAVSQFKSLSCQVDLDTW